MSATIIKRVLGGTHSARLIGEKRVLRGGSWADLPSALRVTARFSAEPDFEDRTIGFRCAMNVPK